MQKLPFSSILSPLPFFCSTEGFSDLASELPGVFVKTQSHGPTFRVSDLVGPDGAKELAFISFQVILADAAGPGTAL